MFSVPIYNKEQILVLSKIKEQINPYITKNQRKKSRKNIKLISAKYPIHLAKNPGNENKPI
jgi:hypothetical protein